MGLFNVTTSNSSPSIPLPPTNSSNYKNYQYCKRCNQSLPSTEFYPSAFYCKRCHKIKNMLSRNKDIISTAIKFWEIQRLDDLYRGELALFRPDSTYYSWMIPLFFASIHEKQWHIYLYAFYMTEFSNSSNLSTSSSSKEKAEKALCKESILTPEQTVLLEKKLLREEHILDSNNVYDLSIPYITQFFKVANTRIKKLIAIFTRSKVCSNCNDLKFTYDGAHNPRIVYMYLTQSPKTVRLKKFHFDRSYSKRDRWDNVCRRCKDLAIPADHPDGLTAKILTENKLDDESYDSQTDIENDRHIYDEYKKNPFKEINEQRKRDKLERIDLEDDPSYIHEYNSVNDYASTTKEPLPTAIHIDEEIFPDSQ